MTDLLPTISRRFDFCASHRYGVADWTPQKNQAVFGPEARGAYGHGHNYSAYVILKGPVDPVTGLIMNLDEVKRRISPLIDDRFDHKFLNHDTPPFNRVQPTPENLAKHLLAEIEPIFAGAEVSPVACHLRESPDRGATAMTQGDGESIFSLPFVTQTRSLGAGNTWGSCARLDFHFRGDIQPDTGMIAADLEVWQTLDRVAQGLNRLFNDPEVSRTNPPTSLDLADNTWELAGRSLPLARIKVCETGGRAVVKSADGSLRAITGAHFYAAHRLHSPRLSDQENEALYGVCSNPGGHGHRFNVECALRLKDNSQPGAEIDRLHQALTAILAQWDYRHLDLEVPDFRRIASTGENILNLLWHRLETNGVGTLERLRLFETRNNRFALRRKV